MEINDIQSLQNTKIFHLKIIFLLMHSYWTAPKMPQRKLDVSKKKKADFWESENKVVIK